ncbi:MAG: hypothetical protein O9264_12990 [Leptospira sp.]|nr:hypothetical protein [Leptospira sp.]
MAPIPYIFRDEDELLKKLKTITKSVDKYYEGFVDIDVIVNSYVSSNTYRAFRKSNNNRPSDIFRNWTRKLLNDSLDIFPLLKTQEEYDTFMLESTNKLCKHWYHKMKYEI